MIWTSFVHIGVAASVFVFWKYKIGNTFDHGFLACIIAGLVGETVVGIIMGLLH